MGNEQSSPLQHAAAHDDIDKVHALISQSRVELNGTDKDGWTPLHFASYWGSHRVMKELLELGAKTDAQDNRLRTPLHLAALQGDAASVTGLCTYKARVNLKDENGLTPLHKAAAQGHNETAEELLAHRAEPNAIDEVGTTPAHLAAKRGHSEMLKLLFIRGADCRLARKDGSTPLHEAAAAGHTEAAKTLISIGATTDVRDQRGNTPRDLAQKSNHVALARLLDTSPDTYHQNLDGGLHAQGLAPPATQATTESESDVKYPTLHKPGQHAKPQAPAASATSAAATDPAEVQYPGIYKPDKKKNTTKGKGPSGDRSWWEQQTNPSFPSATTTAPTASSAASEPTSAAAPRSNPFMKGGALEETKVRDAPISEQEKQKAARDQRNPRKEFESGLMGAAQGVFQFFNKPGQKGQAQGQHRNAPAPSHNKAYEDEVRAVNEDWGNQQAREGEFRVPHQEQTNLDPYASQAGEEQVHYPTLGQRKPAASKASKADVNKELEDLELEVQGGDGRRR